MAPYWRTRSFWLHLLLGWLVAWVFLGVLLQAFAAVEEMSKTEAWVAVISLHLLAILAAFMHARHRARSEAHL